MHLTFPVVTWQNFDGSFTARSVDGVWVGAIGTTPSTAIEQLKAFLSWHYRREPGAAVPDCGEPSLHFLDVKIRPEYERNEERYLLDERVSLRIPYVVGSRRDRGFVCCLPLLEEKFFCVTRGKVEDLVKDVVGEELARCTVLQLARHFPPAEMKVAAVHVRVKRARGATAREGGSELETVAEPLEELAVRKRFSRAWGRDAEVRKLAEWLEEDGNVLLVGAHGIGKSSLLVDAIRQLALQRRQTNAPSSQSPAHRSPTGGNTGSGGQGSRFWLTSGPQLVAGMPYLGQWEERCEAIIHQLASRRGVLCVERLLDLVRQGGTDPESSLASFFGPYLQRGELRLVCETSATELDAVRRLLPGFDSLFRIFRVEPFTHAAAVEVLQQLTKNARRNLKLDVEPGLEQLACGLFRRFLPHQAFPGSTAPFYRELLRDCAQRKDEATKQDLFERFTAKTGLPQLLFADEQLLDPQQVESHFSQRVRGQTPACAQVTRLITMLKAGMNDPRRPLGVYLYCGPTGVGKTELAKTLADYLFGSGEVKDRLIRLDMSEYADFGAAQRLLTQPDGEPSQLIQRVRRNAFAVVLLDEIEKAAPEVFDLLLGMFDEGRLTDRFGRTTNFCSCVILMTSNLGVQVSEPIGFDGGQGTSFEQAARQFFRPEFYNRLDGVVTFHPLAPEVIREIAAKELAELAARETLAQRRLRLQWTPQTLDVLAAEGFSKQHGARPLQRVLQRRIVAELSHYLNARPALPPGTLVVDLSTDALTINHQPGEKP